MQCTFKPGDKVVCVFNGKWRSKRGYWHDLWLVIKNGVPIFGATYTISHVNVTAENIVVVDLVECPAPKGLQFHAACFRKAQTRDITAWLETSTGFEEPTRAPAKRRERA